MRTTGTSELWDLRPQPLKREKQGRVWADIPRDNTCGLFTCRTCQRIGADASGTDGRRHGEIDEVRMQFEPRWPEAKMEKHQRQRVLRPSFR